MNIKFLTLFEQVFMFGVIFHKLDPPGAARDKTLASKENQGPFLMYYVVKLLTENPKNMKSALRMFPVTRFGELRAIDSYVASAYFPDPQTPQQKKNIGSLAVPPHPIPSHPTPFVGLRPPGPHPM
jgi:hypothetical protein